MCEAHMHTKYAKTRKGLWGMPQEILKILPSDIEI